MVGHPGAGKTHIAQIIAERTGAVHLWADAERHKMFAQPTHTHDESIQLYEYLNHRTAELLDQGKSVVFDTNFNFASDRQKLREIADRRHAVTKVIWLNVPYDVAHGRAVHPPEIRNGYLQGMTEDQFAAITSKLETPAKNENVIKIEDPTLDPVSLARILGI